MSVRRLQDVPGFGIDRVAAAAGNDPDVLRMENLDTDVPLPAVAIEATATPMRGWGGPLADRHVRFGFSNEPVSRLARVGDRVRATVAPGAR